MTDDGARPVGGLLRWRVIRDDGEVVHSAWAFEGTTDEDVDRIAAEQGAICSRLIDENRTFVVEVWDPDLPPEFAFMRFGTNPAGMRNPTAVDLDDIRRGLVTQDYRARLREAGEDVDDD